MPKLHELLAVESSLKGQATTARADLTNTFDKKKHHFSKTIVTFKSYTEGQPDVVEEQLELQTTVPKEIDWLTSFLVKAIDAGHQVAVANTVARGDVVMGDGTVLVEGVPATSLLEIEKRLKELHEFIGQIPTLDPAKGFVLDESQGEGVYAAREIIKERSKKLKKLYVLAPATPQHPAQTQLLDEDVPIGTIHKKEWSSLITVSDKSKFLERVEELTRAVKQARSRANDTEADTVKARVGAKLLNYVFRKT